MFDKLKLPERDSAKPRSVGLTNVIDKGLSVEAARSLASDASPYIDLVKLGWCTSLVTPRLAEKIAIYEANDIDVCVGGTMFEVAYTQGKLDELIAWYKDLGLKSAEISNGSVTIGATDKARCIEMFAKHFKVYSEVGDKDQAAVVSPVKWQREIDSDLQAGAAYVILEGRESASAGMYRPNGEMRVGLLDEILEKTPLRKLIFEAPTKSSQAQLIRMLGSNVNLANVPPEEVIALETLRLGLRSDTIQLSIGPR